jgi:hypothetical protein
MVTTDAPGLKRKRNDDGTFRYYWQARTDLVRKGYRPSSVRLHFAETSEGLGQRAARCRILWAEMLAWAANDGVLAARGYDGSIGSLCNQFQIHDASPYKLRAKWNTQRLYDQCIKIICNTVGARALRELIGPDFTRWHTKWGDPSAEGRPRRLTRAKHCMDTVRRVVSFGVTLGYADCARADVILGKMRFQMPKSRLSKLTLEQVRKIRSAAHDLGLGSIALAQTIQFELAMRQKDVIGEWVPREGASGGITHKNTFWTGGMVWSDIDADMILRKTHVKTGFTVEHDLGLYPDILHEIDLVDPSRRVGPMIISEATGEPYKHRTFTQTWRRVADVAGLPKGVWNMDSRSGAISEAYDAGADEVSVMKHAGHKNRQTSAKYNRGSLAQTSRVARFRIEKRTKNET